MNKTVLNFLLRYSIYLSIISIFCNFDFIYKYFEFFNKFSEYNLLSILFFLIVFGVFVFVKNNTRFFSFLYIWKNFSPIFIIIITFIYIKLALKDKDDLNFITISFIIILISLFFDYIYSVFMKKPKKLNERKELKDKIKFLNDNAKENIDNDDDLNREEFVNGLINTIVNIERKESCAFLLSGGWGEGKTSCINFIQTTLMENKEYEDIKDSFEFIKINPWFNDTKGKLLNAILGEINYFAKTNYPYKSFESEFDDIIQLSNIKLNNSIEIALQNILENFTQDKNIQHKITHIGKTLKEEYLKKIIIILDDIDRLSKENILFIMQIVEMFKQYTNLIFILSGDYNKIEQILCETSEFCYQELESNNTEIKKAIYYKNYIEKILNIIKLPSIEEDIIKENLRININKILGKGEEINEERFEKYIECSRFGTLRDIKRFCNAFQLSYLQVKNKINIYNFINLEILFVFYPEIYKDCFNKKDIWLIKKRDLTKKEREEEEQKSKGYFKNLVKNYSNYDRDILLKLIPAIVVAEMKRTVAKNKEGNYSYFNDDNLIDLYFTHKMPNNTVDKNIVYNKFNEWLKIEAVDRKEKIKIYFNTLTSKKIIDFFNKINYTTTYIEIYKVLIETFAELSDKFEKITADFIWSQIKLLLNTYTYAEKKSFYKTIIIKSTNIVFAIELYQQFIYQSFQVQDVNQKELNDFDTIISKELDKKISNNKEKSLEQICKLGSYDYINCWLFNKYSYAEQKNKPRDVINLALQHRNGYKDLTERVKNIKPLMAKNTDYFKFFISDSFKSYLKGYTDKTYISLEPNISNIVWYIDIWGKDWLTEQIKTLFEEDIEFIKLLKILDTDYSINDTIINHMKKLEELSKNL